MYTIYNGYVLDNEVPGFQTLSFKENLFMDAALDTQDNIDDGATLLSERIPERIVKVGFAIHSKDIISAKHKLMQILYPKEAKKLIFSTENDKYFNAIYSGVELENEMRTVISGTISFLCPDPFKYALEEKEFTAAPDADGILTAIVENEGTRPVPVDYEITMNSDNGYVGIVSTNGAMQYGYVEESDGETKQRDEALFTTAYIVNAAYDTGGTCPRLPYAAPNGTMQYAKQGTAQEQAAAKNIKWLGLLNEGSGAGWHGAMKTIDLPADSQGVAGAVNLYCYSFHWFQVYLAREQGAQSILFLDDEDNIVMGMLFYKNQSGNTNAVYEHIVNGKVVKQFTFSADASVNNPLRVGHGHNDFRKIGSKITLYYAGKYYTYEVPELKDVAITKMQIGLWAMGDIRYLCRNYISNVSVTKLNVDYWEDRPNRYANGDVLAINGQEGKAYLNGMVRLGDEITGTTYFKADPGENTIQFLYSDWADPVSAKAVIREAWL